MRKRALFLTIAFLLYVFLVSIGILYLKPANYSDIKSLDKGWTVTYNDTEFTDIELSELRGLIGNGTHKGDYIKLSRKNFDLRDYSSPTLLFESRFSAWRVLVDERIVGAKYLKQYREDKFIGCEKNYVPLPVIRNNVLLEIELMISEDGAYNAFESPVMGEYLTLLHYSIYNNFFVFITSAFLLIFGLMFLVISIAFRSDLPEIKMHTYSSLLCMDFGIWFLTQFELLDLFIDTRGHQTEIEYASLFLAVPIMYSVMGCMLNYLQKRRFYIFFTVGTVAAGVPIIIHFMGIIHMNHMLLISQINAFILFIFLIYMVAMDTIEKKITPAQITQLVGIGALIVSLFVNVFFYFLELAGIMKQSMLSKRAVPMGMMCMVFATLGNYQFFISEAFARNKEHESLAHLAYADGLTGIPNRSRLEKFINTIEERGEDYCIVSIDLNELKPVNDKQGHLMGDKYLLEFSDILQSCFTGKGFIARIGGDEFVAVLRDTNILLADELMNEVNTKLEKLNKKDSSINRSAAFGFAFRHEVENQGWNAVYLLADERMYKKKTAMKGLK